MMRLRRGVTLIELLISIMIISILAAAVLGVAAVAGETAREAKTRAISGRVHTLLMEHVGTYSSRRVELRPQVEEYIRDPSKPLTTAQRGELRATFRLYALREMMLLELPDRWSDVLLEPDPVTSPTVAVPWYLQASATGRTELAGLYLRTYRRLQATQNKITGQTNSAADIRENQSAECLYLIVMNACGDGEARTLIPESSIGDTDGDGAHEFLDGWGQPIEFIRWPVGFESDAQANANELADDPTKWTSVAAGDHDPFDLYRSDNQAFRTMPLIYSRGSDEESGVWNPLSVATVSLWIGTRNPTAPLPAEPPAMLLFRKRDDLDDSPDAGALYLGTIDTATATDNLHNHLIRTR